MPGPSRGQGLRGLRLDERIGEIVAMQRMADGLSARCRLTDMPGRGDDPLPIFDPSPVSALPGAAEGC